MNCSKCAGELPVNALYCPLCGRAVNHTPTRKKRGNGQGTVIKRKNGTYLATVTLGYRMDDGKLRRETKSKVYSKKADAVASISTLKEKKQEPKTLKQIYEAWLPTHRAGKSTMDCYKAAFHYFQNLELLKLSDIDIDDLQECMDECPHGKRTRQNMKAVMGLIYKYAIPRRYTDINLAEYLTVDGEASTHRESFTDVQIAQIKKACGTIPQAELIYMMIYMGFRPSEFLAIKNRDIFSEKGINYVIGGAKTDAGKGRVVPISPKIWPYVNSLMKEPDDYLIPLDGHIDRLKYFTESIFYPTLEKIGIDNPIVTIAGGKTRHKYTPHTCRHTFATLMKRVDGADKDKQELIGHASAEMLRYYQDVELSDLSKIIEAI